MSYHNASQIPVSQIRTLGAWKQQNVSCSSRSNISGILLTDQYAGECKRTALIIYGNVIPVFAILVTIANIMIITVFMKPRIRSHTTSILTMIAIADTLGIVFPTITYVYFYTLGNSYRAMPYWFCKWSYVFVYVLKSLFNLISIWFTVVLALIRLRCILTPFEAHSIHRKKNVIIWTVLIVTLSVILEMPTLFMFKFAPTDYTDPTTNDTYEACVMYADTVFGEVRPCLFRKIYLWTEIMISSIIPCTILIILDIAMLLTLRAASITRNSLRRTGTLAMMGLPEFRKKKRRERKAKLKAEKALAKIIKEEGSDNVFINEVQANGEPAKPAVVDDIKIDYGTPCLKQETVVRTVSDSEATPTPKVQIAARVKNRSKASTSTNSRDSIFRKLDRESRRTSWLIVAVVTIIITHEIPVAVLFVHTLASQTGILPLNFFGCKTIYFHLWGHVTYSLIFLVYCSMSSVFRREFMNVITCHTTDNYKKKQTGFLSPCVAARKLAKSEQNRVHHIHTKGRKFFRGGKRNTL